MAIENVALVNELGQVVNHVVVDIDDKETIDALHKHWSTHRHVITSDEDVIILDDDPEIWTTHCDDDSCENSGFNTPPTPVNITWVNTNSNIDTEPIIRKASELPEDSLYLEKNKANRPEHWIWPSYLTVLENE